MSKNLPNWRVLHAQAAAAATVLFTANTMACLTEALGMSLPYCATALANGALKERIAKETGTKIVELVKKDIKPSRL